MTNIARLLAVLLISTAVVSLGSLGIGAAATHPVDPEPASPPAAEAGAEPSVTCLSFGLYGEITAEARVASLSEGGEDLIFVGTTNGLYVVGLDGKLQHFLYSPFGIRYFALIDDVTGDGIREVVVALNDTQVPALRCYDGVKWERLWQFVPLTKIWDSLWVQRQMGITALQVIGDGDSQSIVVTSGRRAFSLDAQSGQVRWRSAILQSPNKVVAVDDLNGDGTDEVFLSTEDGCLCLLNGKTGKKRWQTRLPEITTYDQDRQSMAEHILALDREAGLVAVASTDGVVRLFDLRGKRLEWEVSFSTQDGASPGPMALVPSATPDGGLGILVSYTPKSSYGGGSRPQIRFLDAAGNELWDTDQCGSSLNLGSFDGKRVVVVPTTPWIKLIDLADGKSEVKAITVSTPDEWGSDVRQIGDDAFLLVRSLTTISSSGDVLWHYPRIANVKALSGSFVGDAEEDTLFSAEWKSTSSGVNYMNSYTPPINEDGIVISTTGSTYGSQASEPEVRLLKVMDGATGEIAWSYEVPLSDLKSGGGLKGIGVTADLVGNDNIQDIIGYRQDAAMIFNGKDGTLYSFHTGQPIASLDVIRNGASGNAIAVGTVYGLTIFDGTGTEIWTTAGAEWTEDETVKFTALDDLNSDNISDLAVLSPTGIVLLQSTDNATGYEQRLTFTPEADSLIEYVQVMPDANGDGVRELASIQRNPGSQQPDKYVPPGCPVLVKRSPVGGELLLSMVLLGSYPTIDLACGDFDGDGCADSLLCFNSYDTCGSTTSDPRGYVQNPTTELRIISGKDGHSMRTHSLSSQSYGGNGWNISPPAANIGDVTGDGIDDLAWTVVSGSQAYSGYCHQDCIEVYDVANDRSLGKVPATSLLREGGWYTSGQYVSLLAADIDGDGRSEILAPVTEPLTVSYEPVHFGGVYYSESASCLAVVDVDSGRRVAGFKGFDSSTMSLFDSHRPGVLGVAAAGGVYYLDTAAGLEVTSPRDGASTGPVVLVRWEGTSEGDFVQVFVDGVRNYAGNTSRVDLYLARGQHDIVAWSIDDNGRILYGPSDLSAPISIKVTPSPWKPVLLVLSLFVLLGMAVVLFYARLHRAWRARKRAAKA